MTRAEEMMEVLENEGYVIVSAEYVDGIKVEIEYVDDDMADVVAFEVVTLEDYENNGYDVEGLETERKEV